MEELHGNTMIGCKHTSNNWEAAAMPTLSAVESEDATAYVQRGTSDTVDIQAHGQGHINHSFGYFTSADKKQALVVSATNERA